MRSETVLPAGTWDAARAIDRVLIDHDFRHRRRIVLRTETGNELLLDLAQAVRLRHGDGLLLDQDGVVRVEARPEPLAEIHAHADDELVRIAWHLGNRHLPVQLRRAAVRVFQHSGRPRRCGSGRLRGASGRAELITGAATGRRQ
jgi:urease accessory protein